VSLRFLADADLNQAIVAGLLEREPALDFMTAAEADLRGRADPEVLEFAASQGRILVSHDTSTMPVHFSERMRSGGASPEVLLVRQRASVGQIVDALLMVWSDSSAGDWAGQIHYLPSLSRPNFRR
jgi:predicted nuclease of predicted toxin-antitoxin system